MSSFVEGACEALAPLGRIERKRLFGGHGLYLDGFIFALVLRDTLYLKSDAQTLAHFEARGLQPFAFVRNGKTVATAYRQAPEEVFEDRDAAREWGELALQAALRAAAPKQRKAASNRPAKLPARP